jgi:hypothetical protein
MLGGAQIEADVPPLDDERRLVSYAAIQEKGRQGDGSGHAEDANRLQNRSETSPSLVNNRWRAGPSAGYHVWLRRARAAHVDQIGHVVRITKPP